MTSGQKIAFSLLTTIVLVAGFVVTAQSTNLFKIIDDRYYSQAQVKEKNEHLDSVAKSLNSYITNVLNQLDQGENAYVRQDCVRSFMDQNPSEALQQERRDLTAQLFFDIPSLSGIRLIDKNGKSVHYSSYDNDVLKINGSFKTYKNYPDVVKDADELEYNLIKLNENSPARKILLDSDKNRIIIAEPFNWIGDVYSGSMYFYFNFKDVEQELLKEKIIAYGENIKLVSEAFAGGIIINLPNKDSEEFLEPVSSQWRRSASVKSPEKILEMNDGRFWLMLSNSSCQYAFVAGVYTSDTFELPQELIYIIYGCAALTFFLISFLLFSFKRSSETTIKKRLKKIQYGIIKEYLDNKEKIEWSSVVKQLKTRKDDLSGDIYSSLGVHSKKQKKHLDEFLEKSWAEIFEVLEGTKAGDAAEGNDSGTVTNGAVAGITMEQLRNMLEEVLQETSLNINVANLKSVKSEKPSVVSQQPVEELDDVEEIEEIEDAEPVEELDDVEEIEEIEDAEPVEELDDVEEVEEIEDAEPVEELDDVEEVEEIEDAEPVEELDDVEEVEEIEDAEPVEELDDVEEVEEIEETEPVDDIEDIEVLEAVSEEESIPVAAKPVAPAPDSSVIFANVLSPMPFEYKESLDTFIRSDIFASSSNIFAEELSLGPEYTEETVSYTPLEFVVYELPSLKDVEVNETEPAVVETKEPEPVAPKPAARPRKKAGGLLAAASAIVNNEITLKEDVEELSPSGNFSMTQFGSNLESVQELESAPQESIIEKNGLFEIAGDLEYSEVKVDESFQSLVDSVLK